MSNKICIFVVGGFYLAHVNDDKKVVDKSSKFNCFHLLTISKSSSIMIFVLQKIAVGLESG